MPSEKSDDRKLSRRKSNAPLAGSEPRIIVRTPHAAHSFHFFNLPARNDLHGCITDDFGPVFALFRSLL
jgi:hypothetical protein